MKNAKMCHLVSGLMVTSAVLYHVMHFFHVTIEIRNVCVFLAPFFSSMTSLVTYQLTKELKDSGAGLIAASMIAIVPGKLLRLKINCLLHGVALRGTLFVLVLILEASVWTVNKEVDMNSTIQVSGPLNAPKISKTPCES